MQFELFNHFCSENKEKSVKGISYAIGFKCSPLNKWIIISIISLMET